MVSILVAVTLTSMVGLWTYDHKTELASVNSVQDVISVIKAGEFVSDFDYPGEKSGD